MERRTRFFWTLTILLAVVILTWQGLTLRGIELRRERFIDAAARTSIGADAELEGVINSLEKSLAERSDFSFMLRNNPMELQKVIFLTDEYGRLIASVQANVIRVSGLFMDFTPPKATAEYQGKEYTLKKGSLIGNEKVIRITDKGIVTLKEGERKFYPLQGRTMNPEEARRLTRKNLFDEETF